MAVSYRLSVPGVRYAADRHRWHARATVALPYVASVFGTAR